jgi:hypothetical protein
VATLRTDGTGATGQFLRDIAVDLERSALAMATTSYRHGQSSSLLFPNDLFPDETRGQAGNCDT